MSQRIYAFILLIENAKKTNILVQLASSGSRLVGAQDHSMSLISVAALFVKLVFRYCRDKLVVGSLAPRGGKLITIANGRLRKFVGGQGVEADDLLSSGRLDRMARASCPFIVCTPAHGVS